MNNGVRPGLNCFRLSQASYGLPMLAKPMMAKPMLAKPTLFNMAAFPQMGMATVDMQKLKQLRKMTGSPLGQCKSVLAETDNDIEKSKELLRKRGLADAEKRSSRSATQGLIGLHEDASASSVTMVQFACETDFVAKTDRFKDALKAIVKTFS